MPNDSAKLNQVDKQIKTMLLQGKTYAYIASTLKVGQRRISNISKQLKNNEEVHSQKMGAPIKITPAIEKEIAKQTCENPEMGAADVAHKIQEIFGVKISRSSVNKVQSKRNSQQPQKITSQDLTDTEIANRIDFYIMQLAGKIDFSKDLKFPDESELITPDSSPPKVIVSTQIPKTDVSEYRNDFKSQPQPQKQLSTVKYSPLPNAVAPIKTYKTADYEYFSTSENVKPNLIAQYAEAQFKPPQVYNNLCHTPHIFIQDNEKTSSVKSMQVVDEQKPVPKKARISKKPEKIEVIEATKEEVHEELLQDSTIFHFGTLSMTHEQVRCATKKAVETAKASGAVVSFDPNLREPLWKSLGDAKEQVAYGLSKCDFLKISDNEIQWFTGEEDFDASIRKLKEQYDIPLIVLSMGKDGSRAYYKDLRVEAAPFLQEHTIETTGAGDTFGACCLHHILKYDLDGLDEDKLREMLTFANAAASIITTRKGALRVMPDVNEIQELIEKA